MLFKALIRGFSKKRPVAQPEAPEQEAGVHQGLVERDQLGPGQPEL